MLLTFTVRRRIAHTFAVISFRTFVAQIAFVARVTLTLPGALSCTFTLQARCKSNAHSDRKGKVCAKPQSPT